MSKFTEHQKWNFLFSFVDFRDVLANKNGGGVWLLIEYQVSSGPEWQGKYFL